MDIEESAMDIRSLMPFRRAPAVSRQQPTNTDPFTAFRDEMNRTFDDFFTGVGFPLLASRTGAPGLVVMTPQVDVSETDKEIQVAAELPGLDAEDIELTLDEDVLTIRGEMAA